MRRCVTYLTSTFFLLICTVPTFGTIVLGTIETSSSGGSRMVLLSNEVKFVLRYETGYEPPYDELLSYIVTPADVGQTFNLIEPSFNSMVEKLTNGIDEIIEPRSYLRTVDGYMVLESSGQLESHRIAARHNSDKLQ